MKLRDITEAVKTFAASFAVVSILALAFTGVLALCTHREQSKLAKLDSEEWQRQQATPQPCPSRTIIGKWRFTAHAGSSHCETIDGIQVRVHETVYEDRYKLLVRCPDRNGILRVWCDQDTYDRAYIGGDYSEAIYGLDGWSASR